MIYSSRDIEQNIMKLVILGHFLFFYPLKTPKTKPSKMKTFAGDIIIFHMCTKNHNRMMCGSWEMEFNRHIFLSLRTIFCTLTPLWTHKIKILKEWKIHLKVLPFYKCMSQMTVIWHMVPETWSAKDILFCHLGPIFYPFIPLPTQKINILKKWNKCLEILPFYTCVP